MIGSCTFLAVPLNRCKAGGKVNFEICIFRSPTNHLKDFVRISEELLPLFQNRFSKIIHLVLSGEKWCLESVFFTP